MDKLKLLSCSVLLWGLWSIPGFADDFAAKVRTAKLVENPNGYSVNADIAYHLSPTAQEALLKGVALAWDVFIEINRTGLLLNSRVYQKKIPYILQFHALLNQYEVKSPGQLEMFLSLNAALNFMAAVQTHAIDKNLLNNNDSYQLAVKTEFNREFLPVPLRPVAYLDGQWFLSSAWFVWPIQK